MKKLSIVIKAKLFLSIMVFVKRLWYGMVIEVPIIEDPLCSA